MKRSNELRHVTDEQLKEFTMHVEEWLLGRIDDCEEGWIYHGLDDGGELFIADNVYISGDIEVEYFLDKYGYLTFTICWGDGVYLCIDDNKVESDITPERLVAADEYFSHI